MTSDVFTKVCPQFKERGHTFFGELDSLLLITFTKGCPQSSNGIALPVAK